MHFGTPNEGHYISIGEREGKWYKFNDSQVSEVKSLDAINENAYLLFYERTKNIPEKTEF